MYRVGDTWWLRIPVGKLHNDRNVPLHPLLVGLITTTGLAGTVGATDSCSNARTANPSTGAPSTATSNASPGGPECERVHPHQLRHTLATQCLNRGMSLEAIAALLGHRSPRHDPGLRPHLRRQRRRAVLQSHPSRRSRHRNTGHGPRQPTSSPASPAARPTGTAPVPSSWTAASRPSARDAVSSRPTSSSSTSSAGNETTPQLTRIALRAKLYDDWSRSSTPTPDPLDNRLRI